MKDAHFEINSEQFTQVVYRWVAEKKISCDGGFRPCYRNATYAKETCRVCVHDHIRFEGKERKKK